MIFFQFASKNIILGCKAMWKLGFELSSHRTRVLGGIGTQATRLSRFERISKFFPTMLKRTKKLPTTLKLKKERFSMNFSSSLKRKAGKNLTRKLPWGQSFRDPGLVEFFLELLNQFKAALRP